MKRVLENHCRPPPACVSINKSRPSSLAAIPKDRSSCCVLTTAHRNLHTQPCPSTSRGSLLHSSKHTVSTNTQASQQGIVQNSCKKTRGQSCLLQQRAGQTAPHPHECLHQPHACRAGTPCAELYNTSRQCHADAAGPITAAQDPRQHTHACLQLRSARPDGTDTARRSCCPASYSQNGTHSVLTCSTGSDAAAHSTPLATPAPADQTWGPVHAARRPRLSLT